ncbi:hypothetical protein ACLPJK_26675 [Pseudomonas aeruginosa]|uniref:hypothetical protein n=1 Tax=Pseudomonas aeruginosa TaxID=287 RepID=UPI003D2AA305
MYQDNNGNWIIDGVNYGKLVEIKVADSWIVVDDLRKDLYPHSEERAFGGRLVDHLHGQVRYSITQDSFWVAQKSELEAAALAVSAAIPDRDVWVTGAARGFCTYRSGKPTMDRKKLSDYYLAEPGDDEHYSW